MNEIITPEERLQKRSNSIWVRQQPIAVLPFDHEQWLKKRENTIKQNRYREQFNKTSGLLFDYNDPDQINSFADILYKHARDDDFGPVEFVNVVGDTLGLLKRQMVDPLVAGQPMTAGLNTLMNMSETMDILANPVKGYLMDGPEGFQKALNRQNYDWDTGSLFKNMALEVISDPLNWLTMGGWAVAKTAAAAGTDVLQGSIKTMLPEILDKDAAKMANSLLMDTKVNKAEDVVKFLGRYKSGKYVDTMTSQGLAEFSKKVMTHKSTLQTLKAANSIRRIGNVANDVGFQTALNVPLGMAPMAIRSQWDKVYGYSYNAVSKYLGRYKEDQVIPIKDFMNTVSRMIIEDGAIRLANNMESDLPSGWIARTVSAFSDTHSTHLKAIFDEVATNRDLTPENIIDMYTNFAKSAKVDTFEEYAKLVDEMVGKHQVKGYFVHLQQTVRRASAIYERRVILQQQEALQPQLKEIKDTLGKYRKGMLETKKIKDSIVTVVRQMKDVHLKLIEIDDEFDYAGNIKSLLKRYKAMRDRLNQVETIKVKPEDVRTLDPEKDYILIQDPTADSIHNLDKLAARIKDLQVKYRAVRKEQAHAKAQYMEFTGIDITPKAFDRYTKEFDVRWNQYQAAHEKLIQIRAELAEVRAGLDRTQNVRVEPDMKSKDIIKYHKKLAAAQERLNSRLSQLKTKGLEALNEREVLRNGMQNLHYRKQDMQRHLDIASSHKIVVSDALKHKLKLYDEIGEDILQHIEDVGEDSFNIDEIFDLLQDLKYDKTEGERSVLVERINTLLREAHDKELMQAANKPDVKSAYNTLYKVERKLEQEMVSLRALEDADKDLAHWIKELKNVNSNTEHIQGYMDMLSRIRDTESKAGKIEGKEVTHSMTVPESWDQHWGDIKQRVTVLEESLRNIYQIIDAESLPTYQYIIEDLHTYLDELMNTDAETFLSLLNYEAISEFREKLRMLHKLLTDQSGYLGKAQKISDAQDYDRLVTDYVQGGHTLVEARRIVDEMMKRNAQQDVATGILQNIKETEEWFGELVLKGTPHFEEFDVSRKMYSFMVSRLQAEMELMELPGLNKILSDFKALKGVGAILMYMHDMKVEGADDFNLLVDRLIHKFTMLSNKADMYRDLWSNPVFDTELKIAFCDALQQFSDKDIFFLENNMDRAVFQMQKKMTDFITFLKEKESLRLEGGHDAATDVEATWARMLRDYPQLQDEFEHIITYDLETTGLNKYGERVLQLAYSINGGAPVKISIKPDALHMPDRSAIITLLSKKEAYKDSDLAMKSTPELEEYFMKEFDVADAVSEEEALRQFANAIDNLHKQSSSITFLTQNGRDFDNPFLKVRAKDYENLNFMFNLPHHDTYKALKESKGHRVITETEQREIQRMLSNYIIGSSFEARSRLFQDLQEMQTEMAGVKPQHIRPERVNRPRYSAVPTMDREMLRDLTMLLDILRPESKHVMASRVHTAFNTSAIYDVLHNMMDETRQSMAEVLAVTKQTNRDASKTLIDGERLKELYNIGGAITSFFGDYVINPVTKQIEAIPFLNFKIQHDPARTWQFFIPTEDPTVVLSLNKAADAMQGIYRMIDMAEDLPSMEQLNNMKATLETALAFMMKNNVQSAAVLSDMLLRTSWSASPRSNYAILCYFNRRASALMDDELFESYADLMVKASEAKAWETLKNPSRLQYRWTPHIYEKDPEEFFRFKPIIGTSDNGINQVQDTVDSLLDMENSLLKRIDALSAMTLKEAEHLGGTPMSAHEMAFLSQSEVMFKRLRELVLRLRGELDGEQLKEMDELIKHQFTKIDDMRSYQIIQRKLQLSPEEFVSELYHLSFGRMAFHGESTYNMEVMPYVQKMLQNREAYEALGVRFSTQGDWMLINLSQQPHHMEFYKTLKVPTILEDVVTVPKRVAKDLEHESEAFKDIYSQFDEMLQDIMRNHPNARCSSLETLRADELYKIDDLFPEVKDIIPVTHYTQNRMLDGLNFNHSIYGPAQSRRRIISYGSVNPLKSVAMLRQQIGLRMGDQTSWMQIIKDPMRTMDGAYFGKFDDDELFELLKNHEEYRAGFLANDKKRGYMFRHVIINSAKDVKFAREEMGAVILPIDIYNRTRGIINDFKITNALVNLLNRMWLQPLKMGMLLSTGMLVRNIIDSNGKALLTSGPGYIKHFGQTLIYYPKYVEIVKRVLDKGMWSRDNIDKVFEEMTEAYRFKNGRDFREIFDIYHRFLNDGATGMIAELEEYFQDTAKTMLRRTKLFDHNRNPILTEMEIREYIETPADMRDLYFKHLDADKQIELQRLAEDHDYYRRAYQMFKHTRNTRLQQENIVEYLKHPELVPQDLLPEYTKLYQKYGLVAEYPNEFQDTTKAIFTKLMQPNGDIERIVRLATYTHALEDGLSEHEAMYRVIKTHFDYANKNQTQLYLEMIAPFSTFAINNFLYWSEHMLSNPAHARVFMDIMTPIWNFDEYSQWDLMNRKTLQNQIMSGNIILDERGTTFKLNPSIMDVVNILINTSEVPEERLNLLVRTGLNLAKNEKYEWETDEDFEHRQFKQLLGVVPILGTAVNRWLWRKAIPDPLYAKAVPSLFTKTSLPKEPTPRPVYRDRQFPTYPKRVKVKKRYGFYQKSYKQLRAESIPFEYNNVKYRGFQRPYANRGFWKYQHVRKTFYGDMASKSGKMKRLLMFLPTDKYNLPYKLRWIKRY